jgi:hypothetical protein
VSGWLVFLAVLVAYDVVYVATAQSGQRLASTAWVLTWTGLMCLAYAAWRYEWITGLLMAALGRR